MRPQRRPDLLSDLASQLGIDIGQGARQRPDPGGKLRRLRQFDPTPPSASGRCARSSGHRDSNDYSATEADLGPRPKRSRQSLAACRGEWYRQIGSRQQSPRDRGKNGSRVFGTRRQHRANPVGRPCGVKTIVSKPNAEGVSFRGKPFQISNVHRILTASTYAGVHHFNRHSSRSGELKPPEEWVLSRVPAIITGAEWEQSTG